MAFPSPFLNLLVRILELVIDLFSLIDLVICIPDQVVVHGAVVCVVVGAGAISHVCLLGRSSEQA